MFAAVALVVVVVDNDVVFLVIVTAFVAVCSVNIIF